MEDFSDPHALIVDALSGQAKCLVSGCGQGALENGAQEGGTLRRHEPARPPRGSVTLAQEANNDPKLGKCR